MPAAMAAACHVPADDGSGRLSTAAARVYYRVVVVELVLVTGAPTLLVDVPAVPV